MSRQVKKQNISIKIQQKSMKNYDQLAKEGEIQFEPISLKDNLIDRKPISHTKLTDHLQIISSKAYQDLINKINLLKIEKEELVKELKKSRKQKKTELKYLQKDKTKVKMDIWEKIGQICKIKDDIATQKQRKQILDQFFSRQAIDGSDEDQIFSNLAQSDRPTNSQQQGQQ